MTVPSSVCMFSVWAKLIAFTVQPSAQAVDATSDTYYPTTLCTKYCDRNSVICYWAWGMGHWALETILDFGLRRERSVERF